MNVRRVASELCWFSTSGLALASFALVLAWIDGGTDYLVSPLRDSLLILSAVALALMALLIALAFSIERETDGENRDGTRAGALKTD